jgi:5-methylcytosine-specific restriction endonuclease McrA
LSSLGKGYIRTSNQVAKGNLKPLRERDNQDGSTETGRPGPSFGQAGKVNQASSITSKAAQGHRGSQAARRPISTALREQLFNRDHYQCRNCEASPLTDKKIKLEVDHIVPVSRGGTNAPQNLQTLCRNCNQLKKASLV